MSRKQVLLLIGAQVDLLADPPIGVPDARVVRANLKRVLSAGRKYLPPNRIIHVRAELSEPPYRETPGWHLLFPPEENEPVLDKPKNNAFEGTGLAQLIPTDAQVVVAGIQSDFCIRATCSAALDRGNDVILIQGAHATYDREEPMEVGYPPPRTPADEVQLEIEAELDEAGVVLKTMEHLDEVFLKG